MASLEDYFRQSLEKHLTGDDDVTNAAKVGDTQTHGRGVPSTELLQERKEMEEVEQQLAKEKQAFRLRMDNLAQRRRALEKREAELQETMHKFDRFIRENNARKERARKRITEEKTLTEERDEETRQLSKMLKTLQAQRDHNKKVIAQNEQFQTFLLEVLQNAPEYSEINELITRHETLRSTNRELLQRDRENQRRMDELKKRMAAKREEARIHLLNCNNKLAKLQHDKEAIQTELHYWENQFQLVQNSATDRTLLLGQIKMAINNLYNLVQRRTNVSQQPELSMVEQLEQVEHYIQDLADITSEYEESEPEGFMATLSKTLPAGHE